MRPIGLILAAALSLGAASARAEAWPQVGVNSSSDYRLVRDNRLMALYAMLSLAGYDAGPVVATDPFPRRAPHPVMDALHEAVSEADEALVVKAQAFVAAHTVSMDAYVEATLKLSQVAPYRPEAGFPAAFQGLGELLSTVARVEGLGAHVQRTVAADRDLLKGLRQPVDAAFSGLRKAFALDEKTAPALVLAPIPWDSPERVRAERTADGAHRVFFGLATLELTASKPIDLKPALAAYAGLLAREAAQATPPASVSAVLKAQMTAGRLPAGIDAAGLVAESARLAAVAWLAGDGASDACAAAATRGWVYAPGFLQAFAVGPVPGASPLAVRVVESYSAPPAGGRANKPPSGQK